MLRHYYHCQRSHVTEDVGEPRPSLLCRATGCLLQAYFNHSVVLPVRPAARLGPTDEQRFPSPEEIDKIISKIIRDAKSQLDALSDQVRSDERFAGAGKPDGQTKSPRIQANDPLEKQQKQVTEAVARLHLVVLGIEERMDTLVTRIGPVLSPVAPTNPSEEVKIEETLGIAPLADEIHWLATRLHNLDGRVLKIIHDRLEL